MKKLILTILLLSTIWSFYGQKCKYSKNGVDSFTGVNITKTKYRVIYQKINTDSLKNIYLKLDSVNVKSLKRRKRKGFSEKKRESFLKWADAMGHRKDNRVMMSLEKSSISNVESYYLSLFITDKNIFSLEQGNKLMMILSNGDIITLLNSEHKIADFTKNKNTYWYASYKFKLNKVKLDKLKNSSVTKFRIYFDKGYRDYLDVRSKKMKESFNCIK